MSPRFEAATTLRKKPGECFPVGFPTERPRGHALNGFSGRHSSEGYFSFLLRQYYSSRQLPQALRITTAIRKREEHLTPAPLTRSLALFRELRLFHQNQQRSSSMDKKPEQRIRNLSEEPATLPCHSLQVTLHQEVSAAITPSLSRNPISPSRQW